MLAGLLFADHDATDRPGQLTATLPFGGVTLIEYQARLLIGTGAAQLVVMVGRMTPELLGALGRIGRRGATVDAVRSAAEAAAKLHPLARVVMLADGLVTTQDVVDAFAGEGGDALLVADIAQAPRGYERLGGGAAWAGIARLDARHVAEVAALPRDYDFASTLLRLADQARAQHFALPPDAVRDGHGIEHSGATLATRGRAMLAATVADRRNWFNALVLAPLARLIVPRLIERGVETLPVGGGGAVLGVGGVIAVAAGWPGAGLLAAMLGCLTLGIGDVLAALRDEGGAARAQRWALRAVPALATAALGFTLSAGAGALPVAVAAALIFCTAIGERAIRRPLRRRWWASPPALLLVLSIGALAGVPLAGLMAAAVYAAATLAAAVESTRPQA